VLAYDAALLAQQGLRPTTARDEHFQGLLLDALAELTGIALT
jgi:hypothetical protein